MATKHEDSDTGNSDAPKRSHNMLPLSEAAKGKCGLTGFRAVLGFRHPLGVGTDLPWTRCGGQLYLPSFTGNPLVSLSISKSQVKAKDK